MAEDIFERVNRDQVARDEASRLTSYCAHCGYLDGQCMCGSGLDELKQLLTRENAPVLAAVLAEVAELPSVLGPSDAEAGARIVQAAGPLVVREKMAPGRAFAHVAALAIRRVIQLSTEGANG